MSWARCCDWCAKPMLGTLRWAQGPWRYCSASCHHNATQEALESDSEGIQGKGEA